MTKVPPTQASSRSGPRAASGKGKGKGKSKPRKRRLKKDAREEILRVATDMLRESGVDGLRLDEIAKSIGVSRQALLHHFGSREALVREVVHKAWTGLFEDLLALVNRDEAITPEAFIERVDDVTRQKGNARLGAWLLLSGEGLQAEVFDRVLAPLPEGVFSAQPDLELPAIQHAFLLAGAALFGDAIFGGRLRQALGMEDSEESRREFHRYLASRLWPAAI